jgi:hypothetical protein
MRFVFTSTFVIFGFVVVCLARDARKVSGVVVTDKQAVVRGARAQSGGLMEGRRGRASSAYGAASHARINVIVKRLSKP